MQLFLEDFSQEELTAFTQAGYACPGEVRRPEGGPLHPPWTGTRPAWSCGTGPPPAFKDMALQILPHLPLRLPGEDPGGQDRVHPGGHLRGHRQGPPWRALRTWTGPRSWCSIPRTASPPSRPCRCRPSRGDNVGVCAVHGNFDDAQTGVKTLFSDEKLRQDLAGRGYFLSSANSINWGRILPQLVYYISAYCDLLNAGQIQMERR